MAIDEKNILSSAPANIINKTFEDPNGIYPKQNYSLMNAPDVNTLASQRGGGHVVGGNKPVMSTPHALDPKQPTSDRQAVGVPPLVVPGNYPYTKVDESESGHVYMRSDAPGREQILEYHRSGTYTEYRPDGSFVTNIVGKGYQAIADDHTIIVKGTCKIIVEGDCDYSIGGDLNMTVRGNYNVVVGGDARIVAQGSMVEEIHGPKTEIYGKELSQVVAGDHTQVVAGNQDVGVSGSYVHSTAGTADIASKGNMTVTTQGTQKVASKGNQDINTQGAQTVAAKGNQSIETTGTQTVTSTGNQSVTSAGTQKISSSGAQTLSSEASQGITSPQTKIDGADIKIGSGNVLIDGTVGIKGTVTLSGTLASNPLPPTWPTGTVSGSVSGGTAAAVEPPEAPEAPTEKKLPNSKEIVEEFTNWTHTEGALGGDYSIDGMYELEEELGTLPANVISQAIRKGVVTSWPEQGDYVTAPGSIGSSSGTGYNVFDKYGNAHNNVFNTPTNVPTQIDPDTSSISTSGSFKLSKYFTLAQLTASEMGGPVRAQSGLSAEQIVKNLMYLSTNVLDQIYEHVGGKMRISSGFRSKIPKGSSSKSQHNKGQAADIQFPDHGADQYYHVAQWIRDNLDYDQLILESSAHSMWIHVSYNAGGNRRQVFSMHNHRTIGQGLVARSPNGKRVPQKVL